MQAFFADHALGGDPIKLDRVMAWMLRWSMIFSENRYPLFRIVL
jgi:hypothetical protein